MDAADDGETGDELVVLVKKLSSFSLLFSGRSSITLACSMSLLMAAIRSSDGTGEKAAEEKRELNYLDSST